MRSRCRTTPRSRYKGGKEHRELRSSLLGISRACLLYLPSSICVASYAHLIEALLPLCPYRNAITNMCYKVQEDDGSVFEMGPGTDGQHSASYGNRTYSGWQEVLDGRRAAQHLILSDAKVGP